ERGFAIENAPSHVPRPDFDLDDIDFPHIEQAVFVILQKHGAHAARHDMGHRYASVVRRSTAVMVEDIDQAGDDSPASSNAMFLCQDGHELAFLVEVGELRATAENAFILG